MSLEKFASAVVGDQRRWWAYRARAEKLPEKYRSAVAAMERYLLHFVPVDDDRVVAMFEDLADLFERGALEGTSIRHRRERTTRFPRTVRSELHEGRVRA